MPPIPNPEVTQLLPLYTFLPQTVEAALAPSEGGKEPGLVTQ